MGCKGVEVSLIVLTAAVATIGTARAADRSAIAIFRDWGAFREGAPATPARCFAIAAPPPGTASATRGAFASVASWPARRVRAQVAIRLGHVTRESAPVILSVGSASFPLIARGRDAWAKDRHQDAAIIGAMRSGSSMSISGVAVDGRPFADVYRLRGAASAIDAAMLACPIH
jgi:hypothetical protein